MSSIGIGIHESDKCKRDVISWRKEKRRERRFRRVIGSAGVDAILSSIPHQPPPGNLYPPFLLCLYFSHTVHTPPPPPLPSLQLLATPWRPTRIPSSRFLRRWKRTKVGQRFSQSHKWLLKILGEYSLTLPKRIFAT